ncbi:helix-turn-helix domain-containing protein [Bacillus massiliglaciei]|uniref:helix-turn-helix domain-containing protein n=1 Tax=Bacillus massiliglaciei TaxID=1816693 RepID=UPI000AED6F94|nr:helix-turn-helix domain-containing protein [Bacillus massiliglaciei]
MKKRIDVIANEEAFHNLSSFTQIEDMNQTVRTYRDVIRASIKRADVQSRLIALLEILKRHSCKQIGVSYMCKNTIAGKMELSYKTVQRLVKKLEDLGMIRQVAMKRKKDMLQTANAIIIQPVEKEMSGKTPSEKSEKCPTIKTTPVSLKQKIKNINKRNTVSSSSDMDKSTDQFKKANFVAHWVPSTFAELAGYFYSDAKTIQEFWKVVKQNNRVVDHYDNTRAFNSEQELKIGVRAIKEFVMKIKSGAKMKNGIFAYFHGIVNNLMSKLYFDVDFMQNFS